MKAARAARSSTSARSAACGRRTTSSSTRLRRRASTPTIGFADALGPGARQRGLPGPFLTDISAHLEPRAPCAGRRSRCRRARAPRRRTPGRRRPRLRKPVRQASPGSRSTSTRRVPPGVRGHRLPRCRQRRGAVRRTARAAAGAGRARARWTPPGSPGRPSSSRTAPDRLALVEERVDAFRRILRVERDADGEALETISVSVSASSPRLTAIFVIAIWKGLLSARSATKRSTHASSSSAGARRSRAPTRTPRCRSAASR